MNNVQTNQFVTNKICKYLAASLAATISFITYLPSLKHSFVWDDAQYITANPNIRSIDWPFFKWLAVAEVAGNWHPLTIFSFAFDYSNWQLNPYGYHLTNILFHSMNVFLVFILTTKLITLSKPEKRTFEKEVIVPGLVTALLFGIHPLHVESVAWISERKDVLCGFFFLLSLLCYLRYASNINSNKIIDYLSCFVFALLALVSKPMAVSLPLIFLIIDYYPLERIPTGKRLNNFRKILLEKIPFFLLSLLASLAAIWTQHAGEALKSMEAYPAIVRIFVAVRAYIFYLEKMIFPINLAPFYSYPLKANFLSIEYLGALFLFSILTFCSIRFVAKYKLFSAVWFYYIITLIPVIGIVQIGRQAAADRYTYLPSLSLFLFVGLGVGHLYKGLAKKWHQAIIITSLVFLLGLMLNKTVKQISIWHEPITLWSHQIKLYPQASSVPYYNRGVAYYKSGQYQFALNDFNNALKIYPNHTNALINRGTTHTMLGEHNMAIKDYKKALKLRPGDVETYFNLGISYESLDNYSSAIEAYNNVIKSNPNHKGAYYRRGNALWNAGNKADAQRDYDKAVKLDSHDQSTYFRSGKLNMGSGDYRQAVRDFTQVIEEDRDSATAYYNRALAYGVMGNLTKAIDDYSHAIKNDPLFAKAYSNRGAAYGQLRRYKEAQSDFEMSVRLDPEDGKAHFNLGIACSKTGDLNKARIHLSKAVDMGVKEATLQLKRITP